MTTEYFSKLPVIDYQGQSLVNICVRGGVSNTVKQQTSALMPYTLQYETETPETVAFDYYNNIDAYWLVNMSNNIIDPYFDWLMPDKTLDQVLSNIYGSIPAAMNTNLFYQRQLTSNTDPYNVTINITSNTSQSNSSFAAVTAYTKAQVDNEAKRQVYLVRSDLALLVDSDLNKVLQNAT